MGTFAYYADAGLSTPFSSLVAAMAESGSTDVQIWYGSPATAGSKQIQDHDNPGVTTLKHTPTDPNAGSGQPVGAIKLAATQVGLGSAVAGAPYDTGLVTQLSGTANAVTFWARVTDIAHVDDATLTITHNNVDETTV